MVVKLRLFRQKYLVSFFQYLDIFNISFVIIRCICWPIRDSSSVINQGSWLLITYSPGADSENLDFVAPPEEQRFYGIFCFFG